MNVICFCDLSGGIRFDTAEQRARQKFAIVQICKFANFANRTGGAELRGRRDGRGVPRLLLPAEPGG